MADAKQTKREPAPKAPGTQPTVRPAVRAPDFRIETGSRKEPYLKLLIYGNYGVGKTTLAATSLGVPSMGDYFMINAEAGDLSIEDPDEKLDWVLVQNFRTLGRIHEYLRQHCTARDKGDDDFLKRSEALLKGIDIEDIKEPKRYRTVIIDSLTEVEAYCFNQLLSIDTTRIDEETQSAEWSEYKKNNSMILRVVRAFRDLPMHVIFTAAEQYQQDEAKRYKFSPDFTGKLSKKIQGFMDMVGYLAIGQEGDSVTRRLYVTPSPAGKYEAKHRYTKFKGQYFQEPSIVKILTEVGLLDSGGAALK